MARRKTDSYAIRSVHNIVKRHNNRRILVVFEDSESCRKAAGESDNDDRQPEETMQRKQSRSLEMNIFLSYSNFSVQ
jgi:hypothetical protein